MFDSSSGLFSLLVFLLKTQGCTENLLHRDPDEEFEGTPIISLGYSHLNGHELQSRLSELLATRRTSWL